MFGRAEEMTDKNLTENDIQLHANQSSNEEAFRIITQLKKGTLNYQFSKKIKTILPNSSLRTNVKHCEKFLQNYRNNYTIVLRDIKVRKKKNIDKSYIRHTNGNYECIDCNEEFKKVKTIEKHVMEQHIEPASIQEANAHAKVIDYRASNFYVKELMEGPPGDNRIKSKKDQIVDLRQKIRIMENERKSEATRQPANTDSNLDIIRLADTTGEHNSEAIPSANESAQSNEVSFHSADGSLHLDAEGGIEPFQDSDEENKENEPPKLLHVPIGKTCYIVDRKSSVSECGVHATKFTPSPNVS